MKIVKNTQEDIEKEWEDTWKDIVFKNGVLDLEQLKKELYDFSNVIRNVETVYEYITCGSLSCCTYDSDLVINVIKETRESEEQEFKDDDKKNGFCSWCEREFEP